MNGSLPQIKVCSKDPLMLKYNHDYENDTTLLRTSASTVVLTFTSEDPDYGTEVAVFHGKTLRQIAELIDIASEGKNTEELQEDGEEEAATIRAEYMTTSLYAWHNMLRQLKKYQLENCFD